MTAQANTTQINSLEPLSDFNKCRYPIVDRNGYPFTPRCRVRFVLPDHHVKTVADEGVLISGFDEFGGCNILADHEHNIYDSRGFIQGRRREKYATSLYQYNGPLRGYCVTAGQLGDPFEHGVTTTFVEIID
jgi:hypothetical protein